jgi:hypothetical protein
MKRILWFAALGTLILLVLAGCMFGMTLEQRIQKFEDDLNLAVRTGIIHLNFHPTMTTDYPAIRDTDFFAIAFPPCGALDTPYEIVIVDSSNQSAVTATINSTAMGVSGPYDAIFSFALDGMNTMIVTLQVDFKDTNGMVYVVQ